MKKFRCVLAALAFLISLGSCAHQRTLLPAQSDLSKTFTWYPSPNPNGSSSISFMLGGKLIYIDPVISPSLIPDLPKADVILLTHTHLDHYSLATIKALSSSTTEVGGVMNIENDIDGSIPMLSGDTREIGGLTIRAFPAYNLSHNPLIGGLALTISDGVQTVFISGDTDMQKEFIGIRNIDVAVFFMSPPFTLSNEDAIKLAKTIKPAVIIPVHWVGGMEDSLARFTKKIGARSQVLILEKKRTIGRGHDVLLSFDSDEWKN